MVLANTRATLHHLKMVAKRIAISFTVITQFIYIGYLIYSICTGRGEVWINATLLALSAGFLTYFSVMEWRLYSMRGKVLRAQKRRSNRVKRVYRWLKLAAKALNLGILLYGVWSSAESATPFSTILTTLMIVFWMLELVFAVGELVVDYIVTVLIEALDEDKHAVVDPIVTPAKKIVNGVKRFFGGRVEEKEPHRRPKKFEEWEEELNEYANKK